MISKAPIRPDRLRRINGSFSWIDHRILSEGFLLSMSGDEILLYFFLVLVGDKNGISFYSYEKICLMLKIEPDEFVNARDLLMDRSLIAYKQGRFQVLQLPNKGYHFNDSIRGGEPLLLKDIFKS